MSADGELADSPENVEQIRIFRDGTSYDITLTRSGFWWATEGSRAALRYFDFAMLPLSVASLLPSGVTGQRHHLALMPDGTVRYGAKAQRVEYSPPPILRPADLPADLREPFIGRVTATIYAVRGDTRKPVGRAVATVSRARAAMLRVRGHQRRSSGDGARHITEDTLLDAHSLEPHSMRLRVDGKTYSYARTARGRAALPRGVFPDGDTVAERLTLSRGWTAAIPVFVWFGAYVQHCVLAVEKREPAPGHRGSSAWRVRVDMYGVLDVHIWVDARTGRVLARRTKPRKGGVGRQELTILRYDKPVRRSRH
jgi:hypothetical protein